MVSKEKNLKNKDYLNLLASNKKYLLNKIELYHKMTEKILHMNPIYTYEKINQYYSGTLSKSDLNTYFIPEISNYIIKNKLYKSSKVNKTRKKIS